MATTLDKQIRVLERTREEVRDGRGWWGHDHVQVPGNGQRCVMQWVASLAKAERIEEGPLFVLCDQAARAIWPLTSTARMPGGAFPSGCAMTAIFLNDRHGQKAVVGMLTLALAALEERRRLEEALYPTWRRSVGGVAAEEDLAASGD